MRQAPVLFESIPTMSGVQFASQPAGLVEVGLLCEGDTVLDVSVLDRDGEQATVYLNRDQVLHLVMILATAANRL